MITNLVATILTVLTTNVTDHWPQKWVGTRHNPYYDEWHKGKSSHPYTLEYVEPEWPTFGDDTNADTKSVEFTVTGSKVARLTLYRAIELPLTNWTEKHWQIDYQRVRTNDWFFIGTLFPEDPISYIPGQAQQLTNRNGYIYALMATNWFQPIATNLLADANWSFAFGDKILQ